MSHSRDELSVLRARIDAVDRELLRLLGQRLVIAREVATLKAGEGLAVHQPERERQVLATRVAWAGEHGLDPGDVTRLFELVMRASRRVQESGSDDEGSTE